MKILTKVLTNCAEANCHNNFATAHFALVDLTSSLVREQLLVIHNLVDRVIQTQPTIGPTPKDGWFNCLEYELDTGAELVRFFRDYGRAMNSSIVDHGSAYGENRSCECLALAFLDGADWCLIPDNFAIPDGQIANICGMGSLKLLASLDGFWFASGALVSAVLPWNIMEEMGDVRLNAHDEKLAWEIFLDSPFAQVSNKP